MLALVAVLLSVDPPACDAGLNCSSGGFKSQAGLHYGSGTPDFQCGNRDTLEDGGWASGSKYCLIETHESEAYSGSHPDLTVAAKYPRSAGLLFGVSNPYFGSGFLPFIVGFEGSVYSYGSFWASQNGGGLRNPNAYAAVYGEGSSSTPDVVVGGMTAHANGRPSFGVWTGYQWAFSVRDDGALAISGQTFRVATNNDALYLTQELPDGGTRSVVLPWAQ